MPQTAKVLRLSTFRSGENSWHDALLLLLL